MMKKALGIISLMLALGLVLFLVAYQKADTVNTSTNANTGASTKQIVHADRQSFSSIKDLKGHAEVVAIGIVQKQLETYNLSRDSQDPSKENTEFIVLGSDYKVAVNRYIKGAGSNKIIVTQENTQDRTPMQIGGTYIFFLNNISGKYMFGGEPYKFKVSNGRVKVDSADKGTQEIFKEMDEKDFIKELQN